MRSEEFLLLSGGLGADRVCPHFAGADTVSAACRRVRSVFAWLCHWNWWRRRGQGVAVALGGAVRVGLVKKALRGRRRAIGREGVA